jgi:hypothetical protein
MLYRTLFNRRIGSLRVFVVREAGYFTLGFYIGNRTVQLDLGLVGVGVMW